jgi:hypothetical protein
MLLTLLMRTSPAAPVVPGTPEPTPEPTPSPTSSEPAPPSVQPIEPSPTPSPSIEPTPIPDPADVVVWIAQDQWNALIAIGAFVVFGVMFLVWRSL